MRATFNVMFFVQKGKCKADGTAPILARLTVNQDLASSKKDTQCVHFVDFDTTEERIFYGWRIEIAIFSYICGAVA